MRNLEFRHRHHRIREKQDIDVYGAGTLGRQAPAAQQSFDFLRAVQQLQRKQVGFGFRYLVQKPILARHVHGLGFVNRRDPQNVNPRRFERLYSRLQHGFAVAQVRSQA